MSTHGMTIDDKELVKAIRNDKQSVILEYLSNGGDPNLKVGKKEIPLLFYTIRYGAPDIALQLLLYKADPDAIAKEKPLIIWAVKKDQLKIARYLLLFGADVNATDKKGNTALITSAWMNCKDMSRLLLNFGASIRQTDNQGNTAVNYANYHKSCYTGQYLRVVKKYQQKTKFDSSYIDGPHVFVVNDSLLNISYFRYDKSDDTTYREVEIIKTSDDTVTFKNPIDKESVYTIYINNEEYPDMFSGVENIFAVNDIHGNYKEFIKLLSKNGIINENLNWKWGRGHLVIIGDVFDRGEQVTETLWFLYKLERQARKAEGYVHFVLGNHEIMVLMGKALYLSKKYEHLHYRFDFDYPDFYSRKSILGKWLRSKNTMVKINDNLFVHGGISYPFYTEMMSIQSVNNYTRLLFKRDDSKKLSDKAEKFLGDFGPFWYRGYVWNPEEKNIITEKQLDEILGFYKVSHIIIGHTLIKDIQTLFHNKVIAVSSPFQIKGLLSHGLFIHKNQYFKARFTGKKELLF